MKKELIDKYWDKIVSITDEYDDFFAISKSYTLRLLEKEEYDEYEGNVMAFFGKGRKKELVINPYLFVLLDENKEEEVRYILYHEFVHFYHYLCIRSMPINCDFIMGKTRISYSNFIIKKIGYHYWTEFDAYARAEKKYAKPDNAFSFNVMVNKYTELIERSKLIDNEDALI